MLLNSVNVYHMLVVWQTTPAPLKLRLLIHVESVTQRNPAGGGHQKQLGPTGPWPALLVGGRGGGRGGVMAELGESARDSTDG